ncbi:hypothetical protein [Hymenobacter terrenus]|uniref:hypothetical protein n=1 Tax=Hymenobacter terrenus TaxID=1629124 RepID=UPI000AFC7344|nr:hypothetical protein [Hymenobacter terrenus]
MPETVLTLLARIVAEVEVKANQHVRQVYLYFNSGIGAIGVENAWPMQELPAGEAPT